MLLTIFRNRAWNALQLIINFSSPSRIWIIPGHEDVIGRSERQTDLVPCEYEGSYGMLFSLPDLMTSAANRILEEKAQVRATARTRKSLLTV